jgi:hypothetical protein
MRKDNHKIRDELGHVLIRLDLSYPQLRLIVEYDGRQHAEDVAQWNRDLERRETFDDSEWRILVVTAKGIYREPARTVERIRKALVKRGCAGVPRQLSKRGDRTSRVGYDLCSSHWRRCAVVAQVRRWNVRLQRRCAIVTADAATRLRAQQAGDAEGRSRHDGQQSPPPSRRATPA